MVLASWLVSSSRTYLKVRAGDTSRELPEEGLHDLGELTGVYDVKNLLHLPKKHHLLRTVGLGPKLKKTHHHLRRGERGGKGERGEREREKGGEREREKRRGERGRA